MHYNVIPHHPVFPLHESIRAAAPLVDDESHCGKPCAFFIRNNDAKTGFCY